MLGMISLNQMIQEKIKNLIKTTLSQMFVPEENNIQYVVEHPADLSMGDYSTNVAMSYFAFLRKDHKQATGQKISSINLTATWNAGTFNLNTPIECANAIKKELEKRLLKEIEKIEVKNGFINFYLSKDFFTNSIKEIAENKDFGKNKLLVGKKVMVEYTDPNPFKPFHIGHLMSNAIGESIARLVEFSGAETVRAIYQGDVGLHVAKAIYYWQKNPDIVKKSESIEEQSNWIGVAYSNGADAYENDDQAKAEINEINKKIYDKSDKEINEIYKWGRSITLEAFENVYKKLGSKFEHYFFESEMAPIGMNIVREYLGKVFEESDGAVVFKGEKHDPKLHTRVFINSQGLPTYEAKEIGLTMTKFEKVKDLDLSIVITAIEQGDYMRVVQKAISLIHPVYESKMKHVTHGMLRFATGKMSSRKGNVITGESLIRDVSHAILEKIKDRDFTEAEREEVASAVGVSALKYSILKQSAGSDVIYDFEKSISFEGDSGPYLQYSYARANSLYEKAKVEGVMPSFENTMHEVSELEKMLYRFPEVVERASVEFGPHYIANYLIDISRSYNSFYGNEKIIDKEDKNSPYKVAITQAFATVAKNGLYLLGIKAPERM